MDEDQQGDIIASWLLQLLAFLAALGFVVYEVLAIGITTVSLDDNAREVARAARDAYRAESSIRDAEEQAQEVADLHQATLVSVQKENGELSVTLEKRAPTLVVHRIGPLEDLAVATQTTRIRVRP